MFYVDVLREKSLRVAVPSNYKRKLLEESHGGSLSGHFAARSMYNVLARRYWWEEMYIVTAVLHSTAAHSSFVAIGRVRVDIMKIPLMERGNQYVVHGISYGVGGGICH